MCKDCKHYDVFCAGTSFARSYCRLSDERVDAEQEACADYDPETRTIEDKLREAVEYNKMMIARRTRRRQNDEYSKRAKSDKAPKGL